MGDLLSRKSPQGLLMNQMWGAVGMTPATWSWPPSPAHRRQSRTSGRLGVSIEAWEAGTQRVGVGRREAGKGAARRGEGGKGDGRSGPCPSLDLRLGP